MDTQPPAQALPSMTSPNHCPVFPLPGLHTLSCNYAMCCLDLIIHGDASNLPKLDLQFDRGSDFMAWKSQWEAYSVCQACTANKQVQALTLCFLGTIVDNLGLTADQSEVLMRSYPQSSSMYVNRLTNLLIVYSFGAPPSLRFCLLAFRNSPTRGLAKKYYEGRSNEDLTDSDWTQKHLPISKMVFLHVLRVRYQGFAAHRLPKNSLHYQRQENSNIQCL